MVASPRTALFSAAIASLILCSHALAVSAGNTTPGPGNIPVRGAWTVTNNTGQEVNDFEWCMSSKEGFPINGASGSGGPFTGGTIVPGVDNQGRPAACVRLDGGVVPPGGMINVTGTIFIPQKNKLYVFDSSWTLNGNEVPPGPGGPPIPPGGWEVKGPDPGGNGGIPGIGGGQGGGGGGGFFVHPWIYDNDDNVPWIISELKLFASMDYYNDLTSDVPWNLVNPIDLGPNPVIVAPNSQFQFDFETTGAYEGGHVYARYVLTSGAARGNLPTVVEFGDHPVPEPGTLGLLGLGVIFRRRRANGCA